MAAATGFIGRQREQAELGALLGEHRLVTLLGSGGIGKTRLAVETATILAPRFDGRVLVAELAGTSDEDDIASVVARQLGVDSIDALRLRDADESTLVVLDNCESAPTQAAAVAGELLSGEALCVLATSRSPLRVPDERVLPVGPLAVPDGEGADAMTSPAVQLFVQRAEAAGAQWRPTDENLVVIGELVRRLDGLPLAIELAAARSRLLAPGDLLDHLGRQLDLLRRPGDERDRHHSLRTVIRSSYEPLPDELQWLLRRLAVLPAPFDLSLANSLAGPDRDEFETLDALGHLVDASLVSVHPSDDDRTSYRLLDSIRAFGLEQLDEHGERPEAYDRYATAMVDFAGRVGRAAQKSFTPDVLDLIRRNFVHLAAAIAWCADHDDAPDRAYRMFLPFYGPTGARSEVTDLADRILGRWSGPARLRAEVLAVMATSFFLTGDYPRGRSLAEQAVDHPDGSPFAKVIAHRTLGFIDALSGRPSSAQQHLQDALTEASFSEAFTRELQISWAAVVVDPGQSRAALEVLDAAGQIAARNDENVNVVWAAVTTAFHRVLLDDVPGARRAADAAVAVADRTGLPWSISTAHRIMGSVLVLDQGWSAAAPHFRLAIDTSLATGDLEAMASAMRAAAGGAKHLGNDWLAERLWASIPPLPGLPVLRSVFHDREQQLEADLGPPTALDSHTLVQTARALLGPPLGDPSLNDPALDEPGRRHTARNTQSATAGPKGESGPEPSSGGDATAGDVESIVRFNGYELDHGMHELRRDGVRVHMEPQVFDVLAYLVANRQTLVTKNDLLDNVWGDRFVSEAALSSRIASARKATGDDGKAQAVIRTVHGKGYVFIAEIG